MPKSAKSDELKQRLARLEVLVAEQQRRLDAIANAATHPQDHGRAPDTAPAQAKKKPRS